MRLTNLVYGLLFLCGMACSSPTASSQKAQSNNTSSTTAKEKTANTRSVNSDSPDTEPAPAILSEAKETQEFAVNNEKRATNVYETLSFQSFKAMGNEPFWNIEIKGNQMVYHQMGFEKETYQLSATRIKEDRLVYKTVEGSGSHQLQLELMQAACEDDMSGRKFDFSVLLTKNGEVYKGCAKTISK
ncbi:MAG: hypothetical protein AAF738_11445, partial [Bacteroidota bacterium]